MRRWTLATLVSLPILLLLSCGGSTTSGSPVASLAQQPEAYEGLPAVLVLRVDDDDPRVNLEIAIEGPSPLTSTITLPTNQNVAWTVEAPLMAGAYTVTLEAVDAAGNVSRASSPMTVEVSEPPEPPLPTIAPQPSGRADAEEDAPYFAQIDTNVSTTSPEQYSDVTVTCRCFDQYGEPMPDVQVTFTWNYRTTSPSEIGATGYDGVVACTRYISGATVGYTVEVTVHATWGEWYADDSVSFTPY